MTRRWPGVLAVCALFLLAGCGALVGGDGGDLAGQNVSYDWDTDANATITVNKSSFTAIYAVENDSEFAVFRRTGLGQDRGLSLSGVRFRYANGTVVGGDNESLSVERGGGRTTIGLPGNVSGQVAFQAPRHGKTFALPSLVTGTYDVTLPPGARVGVPIMADASPPGYSAAVGDDGRVTVEWEEMDARGLRIRWYLQRDLLIFSLMVAFLVIVGSGGSVYYYRQIKRLQERREEVGLDVDGETEDDPRDRGPPPGMR